MSHKQACVKVRLFHSCKQPAVETDLTQCTYPTGETYIINNLHSGILCLPYKAIFLLVKTLIWKIIHHLMHVICDCSVTTSFTEPSPHSVCGLFFPAWGRLPHWVGEDQFTELSFSVGHCIRHMRGRTGSVRRPGSLAWRHTATRETFIMATRGDSRATDAGFPEHWRDVREWSIEKRQSHKVRLPLTSRTALCWLFLVLFTLSDTNMVALVF